MFEIEHVSFDERLLDLLTRPRDKELIVVVGLFGETEREVDGILELHALPIGLEQNAELLGAAECEDGYEHFAALVQTRVNLFDEVSLAATFRVAYCGCVRRLGDQYVRSTFVYI